jgi:hypothetical protein
MSGANEKGNGGSGEWEAGGLPGTAVIPSRVQASLSPASRGF